MGYPGSESRTRATWEVSTYGTRIPPVGPWLLRTHLSHPCDSGSSGHTCPTCGTLAPSHGWCHQPQPGLVALHSLEAHVPCRVSQPISSCAIPLSWKPQGAEGSSLIIPPAACAHLSLSSLRWSMFRGFRRSLRIFFFFSRSVCFFPPFFSD